MHFDAYVLDYVVTSRLEEARARAAQTAAVERALGPRPRWRRRIADALARAAGALGLAGGARRPARRHDLSGQPGR